MHAPLLPSAHLDLWPRQQLPPLAEWPVMRAEPPYVYPPRLNAVTRLLDDAIAEGHGDRIALVVADGRGGWEHVTYGELLHQVDALAQVLVQDLGLVPGNRVLLRGFNGRWMAAAWLATLKAGLVAVTTMPLLRAKELGVIIERAQVSAALCDVRLVDELRQAVHGPLRADAIRCWGHRGEDSLEWLTAERAAPFGAVATSSDDVCLIAFIHRDVLAMCDAFPRSVLEARADDIFMGTPPLAFTFGLGGLLLFPLSIGASTVLLEQGAPQDAGRDDRATTRPRSASPRRPSIAPWRRSPGRCASVRLRKCVSAGEALPDATRAVEAGHGHRDDRRHRRHRDDPHLHLLAAEAEARRGAIGKVVPGYLACVIDDDGKPAAAAGEVGKLAVKGPTGCRYLADERQASYVKNGWNLTGDAYSLDADGYYHYHSRTDDMIISAGYNIAGPEVEDALLRTRRWPSAAWSASRRGARPDRQGLRRAAPRR
jgi:2-aminobenzoate-CoA ligase